MSQSTTKLTWKDYFLMDDDDQRYELIGGELVMMAPAPDEPHQTLVVELSYRITAYLKAHPIGRCYVAPFDVKLTDEDVVQPDLIYISHERLPLLKRRGMMGAPDLAVEILSPATRARDRGVKLDLYRRAGVREYWIVAPELASVLVYRFAEAPDRPVATLDRAATLTTPLLPGLSVSLAELFAAPYGG